MNSPNTAQNGKNKFTLPRHLMWGGAIAAIVIALVVFVVMFMSSSETPIAFLAKWKSALESGDVKKYEALWGTSTRRTSDTNYQRTVELLKDDTVNFEVNLHEQAIEPRRDPRYSNRLRIEGVPLIVHFRGESQQQLRNLIIEKKGIIQERWKIIKDEVVGQQLATVSTPTVPTVPTVPTPTTLQPKTPVAPLVLSWKAALESQNVKKYTALWDKSARKKRKVNFQRVKDMMSQSHVIDLTQATYTDLPQHKNRYVVANIRVVLHSDDIPIESHFRTLAIEKKGFFRRSWKLTNDEISDASSSTAVAQHEEPAMDTVSGETSGATFEGTAPLDTQLKVRQILGKWQTAWEDKDLQTYMGIYAERAQITRVTVRNGKETSVYLTKRDLRTKMQKLNKMYGDIQVSISNLQINGDRAVADATFLQKFTGRPAAGSRPAYDDYGTKKLNLMVDPADGHWKIYAETWSHYKDVPNFPKM